MPETKPAAQTQANQVRLSMLNGKISKPQRVAEPQKEISLNLKKLPLELREEEEQWF